MGRHTFDLLPFGVSFFLPKAFYMGPTFFFLTSNLMLQTRTTSTSKSEKSNPKSQIRKVKSKKSNPKSQIQKVKSKKSNPKRQIQKGKFKKVNPRRQIRKLKSEIQQEQNNQSLFKPNDVQTFVKKRDAHTHTCTDRQISIPIPFRVKSKVKSEKSNPKS